MELKYPQMSITNTRLQTFNTWPNTEIVDIESMVYAGFFYTGKQDHVRCFDCGIGLRNWESEDDPIVEHARWSPNCRYIIGEKGQEFINAVQAAIRQIEGGNMLGQSSLPLNISENDNDTSEMAQSTDILPFCGPSSSAERKNPLLSNAAQALIELLYLPKTVKIAIDVVLKNKGWGGLTSTNLFEVIGNLEMNGQLQNNNIQQKYQRGIRHSRYCKTEWKERMVDENMNMRDQISCKICCEENVSIAFLPCGHLISCFHCAPSLNTCPVCRTEITGSFRVIF